jgi:hypothetical protein
MPLGSVAVPVMRIVPPGFTVDGFVRPVSDGPDESPPGMYGKVVVVVVLVVVVVVARGAAVVAVGRGAVVVVGLVGMVLLDDVGVGVAMVGAGGVVVVGRADVDVVVVSGWAL